MSSQETGILYLCTAAGPDQGEAVGRQRSTVAEDSAVKRKTPGHE